MASSSSAAAGKGTAYDSMEIHELRQALREKGLNASGTKAQLLKRVASFEISREVSQRCGRPGPLSWVADVCAVQMSGGGAGIA